MQGGVNKNIAAIVVCGIICAAAFVVGAHVWSIVDSRSSTLLADNKDIACPTVGANFTSLEWTEDLAATFHWTYTGIGGGTKFDLMQVCPSDRHDVRLLVDGNVAASIDTKLFGAESKAVITDCHGETLYTVATGTYGHVNVNLTSIAASLIVTDNQHALVMYADAQTFFDSTFALKNDEGVQIAVVKRQFVTFPWSWSVMRTDPPPHHADMRAIGLLMARDAFAQTRSSDGCNIYVFYAGTIAAAILGLGICVLAYGAYQSRDRVRAWCNRTKEMCSKHQNRV